ncbi:MAG TPA: hypothetical protein PLF78_15605, partial [Caulobacter sp.]|nr:hypothetical protein [Caulobacter sp.]
MSPARVNPLLESDAPVTFSLTSGHAKWTVFTLCEVRPTDPLAIRPEEFAVSDKNITKDAMYDAVAPD